MASFISANELSSEREKRKEERRKARKEILADAKESFLKEKRKRELKKARGDDTWVAPGIEKRLEYSYEKGKKKSKKHKKKHKSGHNISVDKSDEEVWVEKVFQDTKEEGPIVDQPDTLPSNNDEMPAQRQEWMLLPLGLSVGVKKQHVEQEEIKKGDYINRPGQHPLELNPYWKDGGHGLPENKITSQPIPSSIVGDGGRSWLLRSYKRALEQSEEEGVSMEEIARKRWGSLNNLYSMLQEADIDPSNPDNEPRNKKSKQSLYVGYNRDKACTNSRQKMDKPSYEQFKPLKGFIRPDEAGHSLGQSSTSQSWLKKTHQPSPPINSLLSELHQSRSPSPELLTTKPHLATTPPSTSVSAELVTDAQLNSLAAKVVKAEMLGNKARVERLKKKLEDLRELQKSQFSHFETEREKGGGKKREEDVLLTTTDRFGHTRPMKQLYSNSGQKRHTHTEKGKRNKHFADSDNCSLKSLVEQERISTAEETHMAIARMASKFVPSTNFDETVDDVLDSKRASKDVSQKEQKRAQLKAMSDTRAMNEALSNCKMCVGNELFEKHLMVAMGLEVYLAVPAQQPLTEGHCLLIPREHTACSLQMDENVWDEVAIFRKGLTKMFSDRGMDVVFMEMYFSVHSKRHMFIECIPLPKETGELAPMYFKKAIMEADEEWSDNRKLIDTSSKGLKGSLPKGLPYFFVEFGTDGGYGHIVEDQSKFPWYFGKEVCGGMLDCEPRLWLKPQHDSFERQKLRVLQLSNWWKDYDWTQKLNDYQ